ncbi:MAG TPA: hypothetical protein VFB14_13900 [Bryobacteraceae bacterium]|jgi:hypothetical protein|nr:hypothetical protein [Bryobacteraceae bacterium]
MRAAPQGFLRLSGSRDSEQFVDFLDVSHSAATISSCLQESLNKERGQDGLPGFVTVEEDETLQATALEIKDGKIIAIYVMRNPDKLRHLDSNVLQ